MEGKNSPTQVVDIDDPDIPQHPSLIAPETALKVPVDPEGPTQVSTPTIEGPQRSTIVRSQPDTYTHSMTVKMYAYVMTQL